jgi:enterochelin esterase-like enzyme
MGDVPEMTRLSRRRFALGAAAACASAGVARRDRPAHAQVSQELLRARETTIEGRRVTIFVPRERAADERLPFAVLLHGLGETGDPRMGAWAWAERYGLVFAYERLQRPPVVRTLERKDLTDETLRDVNGLLAAKPMRRMAFVCPHMPNIQTAPEARAYADFLQKLLPAVRREANLTDDPTKTCLAGCSLGSFVGIEVFLKHPGSWGGYAGVQTAVFDTSADGIAERLEKVADDGAKDLFFSTSTLDHYRKSTEALVLGLGKRGVPCTFRISPGPHDQPWLREVGTLEMLLWMDRRAGMWVHDASRGGGRELRGTFPGSP